MKHKMRALALAVTVALPAVSASAITIDGVVFEAGAQFITTSLWESVLTSTSQVLSGVGIVDKINNDGGVGTTWTNAQNDTQLTYYFTGYTPTAYWYDSDPTVGVTYTKVTNADADWANNALFATAAAIDFSGGTVSIWSDRYSTGTVLNPSAGGSTIPNDIAKATDGKLWLQYTGVTTSFIAPGFGLRTGSLLGQVDAGFNNIHAGNAGFGYLDVSGGLAGSNFDTESWNVNGVIADARLDTKVSSTNSGAWPLSGTASIKTNAIPEPTTLALLGLAVMGFAATRRRSSV